MSSSPVTLKLDVQSTHLDLETQNRRLQEEVHTLRQQLQSGQFAFEKDQDTLVIPASREYLNPTPTTFTPYHNLNHDALQRFSRHLILNQVSPIAQNKWLHARVLIIGAGGLGAPVALYLASAGIGHMTLIDSDVVDESNLHRQIIHNETTLQVPKVLSAAQQCRKINSGLSITVIQDFFSPSNAIKLASTHDIIIDCTDNVTARYLTSDAAVFTNRPLISAAVVSSNGQLTTYCYEDGPCYRCVNPIPPPPETVLSCADAGVIGALVGVVGTTQALEALKVLANIPLINEAPIADMSKLHHSWPQPVTSLFIPLNETMIFWDGCTTDIRKVKLRSRQSTCMCALRDSKNGTKNTFSIDELELLESKLTKLTVEWSCQLQAKPLHTPPPGAADITSAQIEPKFRLDRIEPILVANQLQQYTHSQHTRDLLINERLGNLLSPLLIDVRFVEQFQIVSVPTSYYCENNTIMRTPHVLRDLLWEKYFQRYPENCEPNQAYNEYQKQIAVDDGVAALENETSIQRKRRYNAYQVPPKLKLTQEIIIQFNYASQQEQECILNMQIEPESTTHSLGELSVTSPRATPDLSNTNQKIIFDELSHMPVLHTSLLCRRGRWTYMLLDWIARYIFNVYATRLETAPLPQYNINLAQTIPTLSSTFAFLSICADFPPILLSDVFGGLSKVTAEYPQFPAY